ncbi:MAG: pantetheine-phosphate adenylyltransferase [Clostridium sp.]|nr:pantetheine-phosphate adenylyltransferase [Clostridium sp.]
MNIAVYPGSFDPITNGHLDVIKRAAAVFDEIIVLVLVNPNKKGMFKIDERVELIKKAAQSINNVKVKSYNGLLINFMRESNIKVIVKGLRALSDFEYEFQMALWNKNLAPEIETFFMMTSSEYSYVSSSAVKQAAEFGGSIKGLVPDCILQRIIEKSKTLSKER